MITVIRPDDIKSGDAQIVKADLTKFNVAKEVVAEANIVLETYFVITTKEQADEALKQAKDANAVSKALEAKRKELVGPFNTSVSEINSFAKNLTTELDANISKVKDALLKFQKEEEKKALQARNTLRQQNIIQLGFVYDGTRDEYSMDGIGKMSSNEMMHYDDNSFNHICSGFVEAINRKNSQQAVEALENKELVDLFGDEDQKQKIEQTISTAAPVAAASVKTPSFGTSSLKGQTKTWTFEIADANLVPREYLQVNETAIRQAVRDGVRTIAGVNIFQKEGITLR